MRASAPLSSARIGRISIVSRSIRLTIQEAWGVEYHDHVRGRDLRKTVAFVAVALVAIVAIVLSSIALSRDGSTRAAFTAPASGIYLNGPSDRPHFLVVVTNRGGGRVRGALDFQFQDGQTTLVFTFRGYSQSTTTSSTSGVLTLIPERNSNDTSSELSEPPPSAIAATFGARQMELGECDSYLHVTSMSACQFTLSTDAST
jgi:hypothetical protein